MYRRQVDVERNSVSNDGGASIEAELRDGKNIQQLPPKQEMKVEE